MQILLYIMLFLHKIPVFFRFFGRIVQILLSKTGKK